MRLAFGIGRADRAEPDEFQIDQRARLEMLVDVVFGDREHGVERRDHAAIGDRSVTV